MRYWKGWMYLKESSIKLEDGKERVEEGRMKESSMRKNGKVGVCLGEDSVRKWKG